MEKVNPNSASSNMTMTIRELIEVLGEYPEDLPVIATWEGVGAGIRREDIAVMEIKGRSELQIDVENCG